MRQHFKHLSKGILTALTAALCALGAQAAEPQHSDLYGPEYQQAYHQYLAAVEGDTSATRKALDSFSQLHEDNPDEPVALLLKGASQALRGRDAWLPWNKMSHTEDGLENMERAQQLLTAAHDDLWFAGLPVSLQVPAFAGITYVQVPSMFGRFEQGLDLLTSAVTHPQRDNAWPEAMAPIYRYTIEAALEVDAQALARDTMAQLQALGLDDDHTEHARALLAGEE